MSQAADRASFGSLLPGDVLVHRSNDRDTILVTRVGHRLDLYQLIDGRRLVAWVSAAAMIPYPYHVVRGESVIVEAQDSP